MPASPETTVLAYCAVTAARLNRQVDLDRDIGAVATALHHDADL
jgi:hypothetical protein